MGAQASPVYLSRARSNLRGMSSPGLSLLTLNIGNPSPDRAQRQLAWLIRREEDVLVLSETKASAGCRLLAEEFTAAGYAVHYPQPGPGEYGTMIVSTVPAAPDGGFGDLNVLEPDHRHLHPDEAEYSWTGRLPPA